MKKWKVEKWSAIFTSTIASTFHTSYINCSEPVNFKSSFSSKVLLNNYKIITIIKGKKHTLNNVGPPAPISDETEDKDMTRAYILHSYKDIIEDKNDIEEI